MQSTNVPTKITLPFANGGTKNTIPNASQIGVTPGAASFTDGFPPLTFTPLSAGGVPPAGADFNGVLNAITDVQRWQSAGGIFKYDSAFSTLIGGYPKGCRLLSTTNNYSWISTTENNTSDPDVGTPSGWMLMAPGSPSGLFNFSTSQTLNASHIGAYIKYTISGPATVSLPSTVPVGGSFLITNAFASTGVLSVACSGGFGSAIVSGGVLSFNMPVGSQVECIHLGAGSYDVIGGSGASAVITNGYYVYPTGLIDQWGVAISGSGGTVSVAYSKALIGTAFVNFVTEVNSSAGYCTTSNATSTGFTINFWTAAGAAAGPGISANWMSKGKIA